MGASLGPQNVPVSLDGSGIILLIKVRFPQHELNPFLQVVLGIGPEELPEDGSGEEILFFSEMVSSDIKEALLGQGEERNWERNL